jgi:NADH:ubiquinone oxidoreductase subunit F (NADH-binding)/ferredoxin
MTNTKELTSLEWIQEIIDKDPDDYSIGLKDHFRLQRRDRVERPLISIGLNTSGRIAGGEDVLESVKNYILDRGIDAEIIETGAIGLAAEEPIFGIQLPGRTRVLFTKVKADVVNLILDDVFHHTIPPDHLLGQMRNESLDAWPDVPFIDEIPFFSRQTRILLKHNGVIDPHSIEEYMAHGGYRAYLKTIHYHTFEEICVRVEESGLRGRSGSGFLTGKKWMTAQQTPADQKFLVCNAEESDPGAFMDRALMEGNPHQLIEGICIASYAIGATKAYISIRTEYTDSIRKLSEAIATAREYGIIGHNIFNSGFNLDIIIRKGPVAFVCGEETALLASMEGKRGMPQSKPPYPAESGFHRKPTVVNNVETLSNIPHIIQKGSEWFSSIGTEESKGTKIFSVSGRARNRGLIEVPMGTSLKLLVEEIIGSTPANRSLKAVHIGGPYGCIIPADRMNITICYEEFRREKLVLGAGGILLLDEKTCIVDMVKYFMGFMKQQSCGKCIPCREGTKQMSELLNEITRKPEDHEQQDTLEKFRSLMQLEKLAEVMHDSSLCGLGQLAANPLTSSLKAFREEFEAHIFDRNCRSNVCRELRTYYIDVELCTGCTICAKRCPEDAIIGTERHPYFIVPDKCTGCGICKEVCKFSAVFYN